MNVPQVVATDRAGPVDGEAKLADLRFRSLLGADAWSALPAAVRARFGKRLAGGDAAIYTGTIVESRIRPPGLDAGAARAAGRRSLAAA